MSLCSFACHRTGVGSFSDRAVTVIFSCMVSLMGHSVSHISVSKRMRAHQGVKDDAGTPRVQPCRCINDFLLLHVCCTPCLFLTPSSRAYVASIMHVRSTGGSSNGWVRKTMSFAWDIRCESFVHLCNASLCSTPAHNTVLDDLTRAPHGSRRHGGSTELS